MELLSLIFEFGMDTAKQECVRLSLTIDNPHGQGVILIV